MKSISKHDVSIETCLSDDLAQFTSLYHQAEQQLLQNRDELTVEQLLRLVTYQRQLGKLEEAIQSCEELIERCPDHRMGSYLYAALQGKLTKNLSCPDRYAPAPLIKFDNFLPAEKHHSILQYMKRQNTYDQALVGKGKEKTNIRNNLDLKGYHEIKPVFRQYLKVHLSEMMDGLGMAQFVPRRIEVKLRKYSVGEYFRIHQDANCQRRITFAYYLHDRPKAYDGGELLCFDTSKENGNHSDAFSRVVPEDNTLWCFPSYFYHAVLPVRAIESQDKAIRYAINGHIQAEDSMKG